MSGYHNQRMWSTENLRFSVLQGVVSELKQILSASKLNRILSRKKHSSQISKLAQRLSNALADFQVRPSLESADIV